MFYQYKFKKLCLYSFDFELNNKKRLLVLSSSCFFLVSTFDFRNSYYNTGLYVKCGNTKVTYSNFKAYTKFYIV